MADGPGPKVLGANFLADLERLEAGPVTYESQLAEAISPWKMPQDLEVVLRHAVAWRAGLEAFMAASGWACDLFYVEGSPLEWVLAVSLDIVALKITSRSPYVADCCRKAIGIPAELPDFTISICRQHSIGKYRADFFLIGSKDGETRRVIVEVDGHDFHDRTKEQARHDRERDRYVQRRGAQILRFTGSEVFAKPISCAAEAVRAALGLEDEKEP